MRFQACLIAVVGFLAYLTVVRGDDVDFEEQNDPRDFYQILFNNQVGPFSQEGVEKLINVVKVRLREILKTNPGVWPADDKSRLREVEDLAKLGNVREYRCDKDWIYEYKAKIVYYQRRSNKIKNYLTGAAVKQFKVCNEYKYEKEVRTSLDEVKEEDQKVGKIVLQNATQLPFPVMEMNEHFMSSYMTELAIGAIQVLEAQAGSLKCVKGSMFASAEAKLNQLYIRSMWLSIEEIYHKLKKAMIPYDSFVDQKELENLVDESTLEWIKIFRLSRVYFETRPSVIVKRMVELIKKKSLENSKFNCFKLCD